jgi:DNA polymerase II small subunit
MSLLEQPSELEQRKKIIAFCMQQRVLLTKDIVEKLKDPSITSTLYSQITQNPNIPARTLLDQLSNSKVPEPVLEKPAMKTEFYQPNSNAPAPVPQTPTQLINSKARNEQYPLKVIWEYEEEPKKRDLQDFVGHFNARYNEIAQLLRQRQEMQSVMSIGRINASKEKQRATIIGMVFEKERTKNDNIILTVEDPTGMIKIIIGKNKPDLFAKAEDIVNDEVVGFVGQSTGNGAMFANSIIHPDIPLKPLKKSPDEVYAVFTACHHYGSKWFLGDVFGKFLNWIKGEHGTDAQRAMASKVGYLFISGDIIDGVGIYPAQEEELEVPDIYEQHNGFAELIKQIPEHIQIVMIPGNHEPMRLAEPQPRMDKEYAQCLYDIPNVTMLTNPSVVNIHAKGDFPGFDILLYHGYSFDDYSEAVPSIKQSGKNCSERTPLIMKFLLERRHLAPMYTSTLFLPDGKQDPLVIRHVPDIFTAGHIHRAGVDSHRGVTIIACSTFQAKTSFQEKVGHEPDPGKVPVVNLQTRKIHMLKFGDE